MMPSTGRRRRSQAATLEDMPDDARPLQFRLNPNRDVFVSEDGERFEGRGYVVCDPTTGAPVSEQDFWFRLAGGIVADVIPVDDELSDLQAHGFAPGQTVSLAFRFPLGEDEPPVVDVLDADGRCKAGELSDDVIENIRSFGVESYRVALALWEWRRGSGQRVALRLLLAPGWSLDSAG